jgi:hypothetical protein
LEPDAVSDGIAGTGLDNFNVVQGNYVASVDDVNVGSGTGAGTRVCKYGYILIVTGSAPGVVSVNDGAK